MIREWFQARRQLNQAHADALAAINEPMITWTTPDGQVKTMPAWLANGPATRPCEES